MDDGGEAFKLAKGDSSGGGNAARVGPLHGRDERLVVSTGQEICPVATATGGDRFTHGAHWP